MSAAGQRRILAGRYRLEEVIGRGGMSTVYRATDLSLDRIVAVKVALDPKAEENPVYVARFKREARAAAALSHPGAVTVFDAGADGPTRYIVMEFVEGRSLADMLRNEGPLEPRRAARIAAQIADTLAAAHAAGIVHRDIKPGNVMARRGAAPPVTPQTSTAAGGGAPGRGEDGTGDVIKVLDFGIARTSDAVTLTQTASVLGTAPYMAPEQAMGNPADARSDIYSLGCVLFEMLTGQPPFMGDMPAAVLHQHVRVQPKNPSALNPAVPPALDALVLQMLAKAPDDRPQTAAEVRDRLRAFDTDAQTAPTVPLTAATEALTSVAATAAEVPQMATVPQAATLPPEPPEPPDPGAPTRTLARPRRRGSGPWVFLAVVALLLLGAAVAYALVGGSSSQSSSSASSPSTPARSSSHRSTGSTSHSSSTPSTNTSTSSSSTSSSSTSTTTTTVTTTATTPSTTSPPPPGQGGPPPGQDKKKGKKK